MSQQLLTHLADHYTFDGSPSFADLGAYHVPFDELAGGSRVEARIGAGAARGERIVILAASGSGKSSIISHVLGPAVSGIAPIVVPVWPLESGAAKPARVADELLMLLGRYSDQMGELDRAAQAAGVSRRVTHGHHLSSGVGLAIGWLRGELAIDINRQVQTERSIPLSEKNEVLTLAFERIGREGLQPIVVFDDTDRWLSETDAATVAGFMRDTVRWLTAFPVSVVVAAHHHYFATPGSRAELLGFLDTRVELPRLPDAAALTRILSRRIALNVEGFDASAAFADAISDDAVETLFGAYAEGASLRRVLQLSHIALVEATSADAEVITADHVIAALRSG